MSADDFQTKYASVMESMLKSAVAETTKLFETMVDELKAEISRIKKENDDLKTKCREFENAKIQPAADTRDDEPLPGTSDGLEKRDTAVQCDLPLISGLNSWEFRVEVSNKNLVPVRTMLVEQCQTVRDSSLQNQDQQWCYEAMEYGFQEHNYVTQNQGDSQMADVQVKQEQEQDERTVACGQVVIDKAGLPWTSVCEMENEGFHIDHESSTAQVPLPQKNRETPEAWDLPCFGMNSDLQGVRNQSSEPKLSLVISLAALKDDLEEKCEISLNTSKIETQTDILTSDEHHLVLSQHQSVEQLPREGEMSVGEQSHVILQKYGNVQCTVEQLAEPTPQNKEVANEAANTGMEEGEATSKPVSHKRGRLPRKAKHLQQQVKKDLRSSSTNARKEEETVTTLLRMKEVTKNTVNTTVSSPVKSKQTSSIISLLAQEDVNSALEDADNSKIGSISVSVVPLSRGRSSERTNSSESEQLFTEMEKTSTQASSNEDSSATELLNTSPAGSSNQLRQRRTSATLQDAMLLVEAMNQSTVENTLSSLHRMAALPQTQCTPFVGTLPPVDEIPAKPQKPLLPDVAHEVAGKLPVTELSTLSQSTLETHNVAPQFKDAAPKNEIPTHLTVVIPNQQHTVTPSKTTAPSPSLLSAANQASVRSIHSKHNNAGPQKIIVVPRSASSLMPHKIATLSPSQLPAVVSTVVATQNHSLLPICTTVSCRGSVLQKTIYVSSGKLLPVVPSQSSAASRDQQSETVAQPKITIIIPKPPQSQTIRHTQKQDSSKPDSPGIVATPQLSSSSQSLRVCLAAQTTSDEVATLSRKKDKTSDNLESTKRTMSDPKSPNAPTDSCSTVKTSAGQVEGPAFPVVKPMVEPKFSAIVRLTRLPLQVSTKDSVLVSRLLSSETQSMLINTPKKPSSMIIINQSSAKPVLSNNMDPSLKESSVAVSVNTPQMSEEPNSVEEKALAFSETSTILEESPESSSVQPATSNNVSVATSTTEPLADEPTFSLGEEITGNVVLNCALQNDPTFEEKQSAAPIKLTVLSPKDTSDPHLQMTKSQFLAKLAVSPIVEAPEKASADEFAEATACGKKRLLTNSLVARLRSHLKSHLQTKRAESNPEQCIETETTDVSPKKLRLENDVQNDKNANKPMQVRPTNQVVVEDVMGTKSNPSPFSPSRPGLCKGYVRSRRSVIEPNTVSSRRLNDTSESTLLSSGKRTVGSKNKQPSSISPRRSSSTTKDASPKNTKFNCVSPKRTGKSRNGTSPKNTKSTCVSPKKTNTSRNGTSPKKTPTYVRQENKTGRDGVSSPQNKSISGSPRMDRRSTLTKINTKKIKRDSSSFTPGRCTATEKAKRETASSRVGLTKGSVSPKRTEESTPAKKTRSRQHGSDSEKSLKVVSAKKLAKAAKAKKMAKIRLSKQLLKFQDGDKTSQLAENQANCETVKKCTSKAIWVPPKMPVTKTPKKDTRFLDHSSVYTSSVCFHRIPVRAPPIVSPLQPLSVIGGRLLKNQCGECGRVLSSSAALESHVGLHTGRRPFSCTLCGKSFPDSKGLKRHGRVHRNGRIHVCQQCGKGFVYRFGLTKHLQMVHGRLKPFVCQICNKGFYAKRDVEAHIRIHTGEKPFHCNLCDKKFTRRVELNVHLRWHNGEKRHWCPFCGKGFLDFNNLKRHKYIHTGEKPHSCPHCPKHFTQSGHLKKHVKNVHKIL
ncbi:uncharacterized protein [Channa argus]|uniref:uncharacterized protein isoform X2 n=1 Tax=Channa argus TaxID=215402 RepID=UPI00352067AA